MREHDQYYFSLLPQTASIISYIITFAEEAFAVRVQFFHRMTHGQLRQCGVDFSVDDGDLHFNA